MDKENMDIYVVSLTYGMSNEKTAQKYARALTKTMNFKQKLIRNTSRYS